MSLANTAMKVFSFKQSICFLEPEVKNGAKHTFDNESFGVLPCFFKLHILTKLKCWPIPDFPILSPCPPISRGMFAHLSSFPKKLGQCLHNFVFLVEEILIISNFANGPLWGFRYILLQLRPQIAVSVLWFYGSGTFCGHQRQSVEQYFMSQTDPPQWYIYDIMTILKEKQLFNFLKVWKKKCCFCS